MKPGCGCVNEWRINNNTSNERLNINLFLLVTRNISDCRFKSSNTWCSVICSDSGAGGDGGDGHRGARGAGRSWDGLSGVLFGDGGDQQRLRQHGSRCLREQREYESRLWREWTRGDVVLVCFFLFFFYFSAILLVVALHRTGFEVWHRRTETAVDHTVHHRREGGLLRPQWAR